MSQCHAESMTNHHHDFLSHPVTSVADVLHTWRERYESRRELARLSETDFHDVGASWSDFAIEANKPFWRE